NRDHPEIIGDLGRLLLFDRVERARARRVLAFDQPSGADEEGKRTSLDESFQRQAERACDVVKGLGSHASIISGFDATRVGTQHAPPTTPYREPGPGQQPGARETPARSRASS